MTQLSLNLLTLSINTPSAHELAYMVIYVILASMVYLVMVKRAGEELDRKVIDAIFFIMIGSGSIIWVLSKVPPIS